MHLNCSVVLPEAEPGILGVHAKTCPSRRSYFNDVPCWASNYKGCNVSYVTMLVLTLSSYFTDRFFVVHQSSNVLELPLLK